MREDLLKQLSKLMKSQLLISDDANLSEDSNFYRDLGMDSLDRVVLILAVEREYNTSINDEDAESIDTVKTLIDWMISNVNKFK